MRRDSSAMRAFRQQNSAALIRSAGCRWARRGVHADLVGKVPRLATGDGLGLQHQVVFVRWGGLPELRPMCGDIDGLLSAACMGVGRSLQACYATRGSVGLFHDGHPSMRAVGILAGARRSLVCCMQVGGYRPQFRPHRRVIETPGRNPCLFPAAFIVLAVSLIPAQEIPGALRS
ncbi:hypothetical protein SAMN04490185_3189 [Pseudomonas frederiksbergensis]|uniref:Uncharacterized protein n=1 Tax=Pseudomonas frederiksbergensis TaxID=104087 RepID=A0A1H4ZI23_9PSED|nr:hypothetical protein SAMN04490185_3189 [Pseudomonas frederiksbergensis]